MSDKKSDSQPVLSLYNSLTRKKEVFTPQDPSRVTMYNCGPTVYSYAHIGNARAAVVADVLFRVLRHIYGEDHVVYARNITDVDDKIIASAAEQGVDISVITEKYARIYNEDLAAIGCLPPTHQPKATDHIDEMQDIIVELMDKDIAYHAEGHILFDVTRMDTYARETKLQTRYGALSGRKMEDNLAGARVQVAGYKRNAGDFILWKPATDDEPGWDFKNYGRGRPGWHIECSAMIRSTLGETIDIHCGGIDLKFPHHENEIAQSHCANDKPLANFWVHNEFLNMGSEKMSKSLGNVTLIHDLLKEWDGEVIRLALLKAHYRSELSWSEDLLRESKANLDKAYSLLKRMTEFNVQPKKLDWRDNFSYELREAGTDDLKLDEALGSLIYRPTRLNAEFAFMDSDIREASEFEKADIVEEYRHTFSRVMALIHGYANLLGLLQKDPEDWFSGGISEADHQLAKDYDAVRAEAMAAKSAGDKAAMGAAFAKSDAIRDTLTAKGLVIETDAGGTSTLRKA